MTVANLPELAPTPADWIEKIREKAYAWREWALPPQPQPEVCHMRELKDWKAGLGVVVPSLHSVQRQAVAVLEGQAGSTDPLVNAAVLTIGTEGLPLVVEAAGLLGAVQALTRLKELDGLQEMSHPCRYRWLSYKLKGSPNFLPEGLDLRAWGMLRNALSRANQAEYDRVVEWARQNEGDLETKVMLAFLLPDQNWAEGLVVAAPRHHPGAVGRTAVATAPHHSGPAGPIHPGHPHHRSRLSPATANADGMPTLCGHSVHREAE